MDQAIISCLEGLASKHPEHEERLEKGRISFPLAPSVNERLKWKVDNNGKESVTEWRICEELKKTRCTVTEDDPSNNPLILELKPITGRTHQLRVHCAHVGSGIEGDSLYGATKMEFDPHSHGKLKLHAWKLVFPHPDHRKGTWSWSKIEPNQPQKPRFGIIGPWFDFDHENWSKNFSRKILLRRPLFLHNFQNSRYLSRN